MSLCSQMPPLVEEEDEQEEDEQEDEEEEEEFADVLYTKRVTQWFVTPSMKMRWVGEEEETNLSILSCTAHTSEKLF